MSTHNINDTSVEICGQHLLMRSGDKVLLNLHFPKSEHYALKLECDEAHSEYRIVMYPALCGSTKLFETTNAELAHHVMQLISDALLKMSDDLAVEVPPKRINKSVLAISGVMFMFLVGSWVYSLTDSSRVEIPVMESILDQSQPRFVPELQSPQQPMPAPEPTVSIKRATLSAEDAAEARQLLASRLKNGAEKQEFTIRLSSGHPRSLYVFSDPACSNCRVFEPTVQALSQEYNVEIFPVTLIGKARTAELVAPMLCAPAEKRAQMWGKLFDLSAGMLNPSAPAESTAACEAGLNALARNDLAFDMYRFPGTPTVISDDGRLIPLQAMTSDVALRAFLNGAAKE